MASIKWRKKTDAHILSMLSIESSLLSQFRRQFGEMLSPTQSHLLQLQPHTCVRMFGVVRISKKIQTKRNEWHRNGIPVFCCAIFKHWQDIVILLTVGVVVVAVLDCLCGFVLPFVIFHFSLQNFISFKDSH